VSESTNFTNDVLANIPHGIERLYLRALPRMTDDIFDEFPKFPYLTALDLSESGLSFSKLHQLSGLNLKDLFLWRSLNLQDEHLVWLAGKSLGRLDISFCRQLTDACLPYVTQVETLFVDQNNYITNEALSSLQESNPKIKEISNFRR
jgi:hypothetical protein